MGWITLALAATQASAEVALVCLAGALLARKGVFTQQVQRAMAKANMVLFTPCLLFVKIAATVTADKFLELWPVPLAFVLFSALSWVLAVIGSSVFRLSEPQRRLAIVSMMFSNSNSLPIALMQSLSLSKSVSVLYWGDDDTVDAVVARGMTYIMFFGLAGNFVRWSYGYELIGKGDGSESEAQITQNRSFRQLPPEASRSNTLCGICRGFSTQTRLDDRPELPAIEVARAEAFVSAIGDDDSCTCAPETPLLGNSLVRCRCPGGPVQLKSSLAKRAGFVIRQFGKSFWRRARSFIRSIMTAPIFTTLVALLVGLVTPLRNLLFGPDAPLRPSLTAAIDQCGNASVPLILLSLGAQLATLPSTTQSGKPVHADVEAPSAPMSKKTPFKTTDCDAAKSAASPSDSQEGCSTPSIGASTSTLVPSPHPLPASYALPHSRFPFGSRQGKRILGWQNYRTIALVLFGRLVVSPFIAAPIVFAARPYMGALAHDPVFLLVLVLLGSSPTAINLIQICQVHGYFEADMARLLFVSYIAAVPIMTAVVTSAMATLDGLKNAGSL